MIFVTGARGAPKDKAVRTLALKMKSAGASDLSLCCIFFRYTDFSPHHLEIFSEIVKCKNIIGSAVPFIYTKPGIPQDIACIGFDESDSSTFFLGDIKSSEAPLRLESLFHQVASRQQRNKRGLLLGLFEADIEYPPSLTRAIQRAIGLNISFIGIASATLVGYKMKTGGVLYGGQVCDNAFAGLYLKNIRSAFSFASGFKPVGRSSKVTSYYKNIVKSVEKKPANLLYHRYFGPKYSLLNQGALNLISTLYPLGFRKEEEGFIIRAPSRMKIDGSLEFWGDVPSSHCQFMISTKKDLIDSTVGAFKEAIKEISSPQMILVVDSAARVRALGDLYYRIFDLAGEAIGSLPVVSIGVPYSMGKISFPWGYSKLDILDHTATIVVLGRDNE